MTLEQPIWLILAIPLALIWWRWPPASRTLRIVRALILILALLAMAGPAMVASRRGGTVVVVADRSRSMPADAGAQQVEAIHLLQHAQNNHDHLAVVSFGRRAAIEQAPDDTGDAHDGDFPGFTQQINPDGSNLNAAVTKALSLIPHGKPGKILILSDGRWTGSAPRAAARQAAQRNIPINYRRLARPSGDDLAIARLAAPIHVASGESFLIHAWVHLPLAAQVTYQLQRGDTIIASGKTALPAGLDRLTFRDQASNPGVMDYTLHITSHAHDPIPENNTARLLIGIDGPKPLLLLTDAKSDSFAHLLRAGSLKVDVAKPAATRLSLTSLTNYAGVILENVPARDLTLSQMQTLAAWVQDAGNGLLMTGGRQSFGPGGYFQSPIDPILPVSMELRQEDRKFSVAIVVALDRSGSMAVRVPGGPTKMTLADLGTAQVLKMLSPMDQFGVLAVDTSAHTIVPFGPVPSRTGTMQAEILHIRSLGGGIFIYQALSAAARMIQTAAPTGARHIILFADANDSEEPGDYKNLIKACNQAGITISVIGMGSPADSDAGLLRDIARRAGGKVYFANDPRRIPELFAQDTFLVARSTFIDQATAVKLTGGLTLLTNQSWPNPPTVGGYNLCYVRPAANLAAMTQDQYHAPLIATWHAGVGRVACYTGEVDGKYTGAIAHWKHLGAMFSSLARWIASQKDALPGGAVLTQRVTRGVDRIELHLDPDHPAEAVTSPPIVTTLQGTPGHTPVVTKTLMRWVTPDTLAADIPLNGGQTALSTVHGPGLGPATLTPVCLPYSPEYAPAGDDGRGLSTLTRLARITGGSEQTRLASLWSTMPKSDHLQSLTPWFALAALVLLLLEVFERRTGLVAAGVMRLIGIRRTRISVGQTAPEQSEEIASNPMRPARQPWFRKKRTAAAQVPGSPTALEIETSTSTASPPPPPSASSGVLDAMKQARHRADQRLGRK